MKLWIDTEFNEYKGALISLALVAEDGREWYGVRYCDDPGWWVNEHVMPYLVDAPQRDCDLRASLDRSSGHSRACTSFPIGQVTLHISATFWSTPLATDSDLTR